MLDAATPGVRPTKTAERIVRPFGWHRPAWVHEAHELIWATPACTVKTIE